MPPVGSKRPVDLTHQVAVSGEVEIEVGHGGVVQAPNGVLNVRHALPDAKRQLGAPVFLANREAGHVWMTGVS